MPIDYQGAKVFVRGVATWLFVLSIAYLFLALSMIDVQRMAQNFAQHVGDVLWPGLPWGLTGRQLILGASVMTIVGLVTASLLWRLTPLGRILAIAYLTSIGLYAVTMAWFEGSVSGVAFGVFNLWLVTVLLRKDATRACRAALWGQPRSSSHDTVA